jgi:RsiW-degrading membrane proteinase PrsW (M82 family)
MLDELAVVIVSVFPAAAFLVLILRMDRAEPEPLGAVVRMVGLGCGAAIVASLVELGLDAFPLFHAPGFGGAALSSFVQVAPIEEGSKLAAVLLFAWRWPSFNEENDGVVYVGAAAIGFALLENILFVAEYGLGTGALRAFTAVPLHVLTGVVMGLYVGRARLAARSARRVRLVLQGFAFAWLVHGAYDTFAFSENALTLLLLPLLGGLAAFGVLALRKGRRLSLLRWGPNAAPHLSTPAHAGPPRRHLWMPVISRTLLGASALFWGLVFLDAAIGEEGSFTGDALLGGLVITLLPIAIGVLLEIAWQRRRRARGDRRAAAASAQPHVPDFR